MSSSISTVTASPAVLVALPVAMLAVGLALGFLLGRQQAAARLAGALARLDAAEESAQARLADLDARFAQVSGALLQQAQETLLRLAGERFDAQQGVAEGSLAAREQAIAGLLAPMTATLARLEENQRDLERARTDAYAALREQMDAATRTTASLHQEAQRLRESLRTTGTRGRWGEMQLRRIVELGGMVEHCDFVEQASAIDTGGDSDRGQRPDMVVRLTQNRTIVVDSKVPLDAYLTAMDVEDETARRTAMKAHAKAFDAHITGLAKKAYPAGQPDSPEFVVLFVPGEPFLRAAVEADPTLLEKSMRLGVVLATPTILVALLRTVAHAWQQDSMSREAAQVHALGKELLERLVVAHGHLVAMGKGLGGALKAYNDTVGSLETRVLVTARRMSDLALRVEVPPLGPVVGEVRDLAAVRWGVDATQAPTGSAVEA